MHSGLGLDGSLAYCFTNGFLENYYISPDSNTQAFSNVTSVLLVAVWNAFYLYSNVTNVQKKNLSSEKSLAIA